MHATPSTKRLWLPSPLLLFLLPALLLIVVFFVVPIGITGVISLTSLDYRFRWDFVGLANFLALVQDALIPRVLLNTGGLRLHHVACISSRTGARAGVAHSRFTGAPGGDLPHDLAAATFHALCCLHLALASATRPHGLRLAQSPAGRVRCCPH
jgi:hypothetical protein